MVGFRLELESSCLQEDEAYQILTGAISAEARRDDRTSRQRMVAAAEEAERLGKNDWLTDM